MRVRLVIKAKHNITRGSQLSIDSELKDNQQTRSRVFSITQVLIPEKPALHDHLRKLVSLV